MPIRPMTMQPLKPRTASSLSVLENRDTGAHGRGYDADWKRVRLLHLATEPLCRRCNAAGKLVPAAVVNHIEDIRDRPDLRLDDSNLESLCKRCHDRHTAIKLNRQRKQARMNR